MIPTAVASSSASSLERHASRDAVLGSVAGIVAMVPEGLVLLTSVAFAIGVVRLGQASCLVQELPAIEGSPASTSSASTRRARSPRAGMVVDEVELLGEDGRAP